MPERVVLNKGTKEHLIVDLADRLGELTSLDGTNPVFSVRRRGELNPIIQQGSPTALGLTAYCLLDTTLIGYNSDGEYELFVSFTAAPEAPVVGPFRFELNNVGVTLPDDEDAVAQYDLSSYQLRSEKGQLSGYASLGLDGIVPSSQLPSISTVDPIAQWASRTLTSAEILTLTNPAIEIVPASGLGKILIPLAGWVHFQPGSIPYGGSALTLVLGYGNSFVSVDVGQAGNVIWSLEDLIAPDLNAENVLTAVVPMIGRIDTTDQFTNFPVSVVENAPLSFGNVNQFDLWDGDGSLTVHVLYSILELAV